MKKKEFTPWFSDHTKPARAGIYHADWQVYKGTATPSYAYFDGIKWGWMYPTKEMALHVYKTDKSKRHEKLAWRGLTRKSFLVEGGK